MKWLLSATLLGVSAPAALAGEAPDFEWTGHIDPAHSIRLYTINGDIRVETTDGPVEVRVWKHGSRPDPASVRIDVVPFDNGIAFCTMYADSYAAWCSPNGPHGSVNLGNSDLRIEFEVRVPRGVIVRARTVNGSIDAELADNPVDAETVNGEVWIGTDGPAQGKAVNGTVTALLGYPAWKGVREFAVVNGSVHVQLPKDVNARVEASTVHGRIVTNFPLRVRRYIVGSKLEGDLGEGGPTLQMSVVNGNVHLRGVKVEE